MHVSIPLVGVCTHRGWGFNTPTT